MIFKPVDSALLFSRNDPKDPRLGDLAKIPPPPINEDDFRATLEEGLISLGENKRHFVLAGYPDEEGIRLNGGRLGAALAPDSVRRPLYKMTPNVLKAAASSETDFILWDVGNLNLEEIGIEERHRRVSSFAQSALETGARWIGIGGGHDYGFPDAEAFIKWCQVQGQRPLILNFDAHLDVRPTDRGLSSGTPFYRMLEKYPAVDFAEIGIQNQCNSAAHFTWARSKGARILTQDESECSSEAFSTLVLRMLGDCILRPRPVFLSIDIDGFSSSVAPGCSQSWATGFLPQDFFACLQILSRRLDVRQLGIYEVSPPLDQDDRTAKLAAQIIHRVVN